MRTLLHHGRAELGTAAGKIHALSPLSTLERGFAVPLGEEGRVLRRVQDFRARPSFTLRVVDGRVRCESIEFEEEG